MSVAEIVAKLVRQMDPNPYTGLPPSIEDIIELVRRSFGDEVAAKVKVTVH